MRILFVSSTMPILGGVSSYIEIVSGKLREMGHDTKKINVLGSTNSGLKMFSQSITQFITFFIKSDLFFIMLFYAAKFLLRARTKCELKQKRVDVIHVQDVNSFNGLYPLCKNKGIRIILTVHAHLSDGSNALRKIDKESLLIKFLRKQELKAFKAAPTIITVSAPSYNVIKKIATSPEQNVFLMNNFVNSKNFYPFSMDEKLRLKNEYQYEEQDFIVIHAGRLAKAKGVIYVLKAMLLLSNEATIKLIVAGDGPEDESLKEFVEINGLQDKVRFLGAVTQDELLRLHNISDVFILASIQNAGNIEGTPIGLLEAMACALPIITTDNGGIKDILKVYGNDLLVKEKNEEDIVKQITHLYHDIEFRKALSEKALHSILTCFSADINVKKLVDIYLGKVDS